MAAACPMLRRRSPLLGPLQDPNRQTGLLGDVSLRATGLDPRRSDGSGEGQVMRRATAWAVAHGVGRQPITLRSNDAPQ